MAARGSPQLTTLIDQLSSLLFCLKYIQFPLLLQIFFGFFGIALQDYYLQTQQPCVAAPQSPSSSGEWPLCEGLTIPISLCFSPCERAIQAQSALTCCKKLSPLIWENVLAQGARLLEVMELLSSTSPKDYLPCSTPCSLLDGCQCNSSMLAQQLKTTKKHC